MTKAEAGRLGGKKTAERYGTKPFYCKKYGCLCPKSLECKSEFHQTNSLKGASKGGTATFQKHGRDYMAQIGKMGGRSRSHGVKKDDSNR